MKNINKNLENWKPFLEREVVDLYDSIVNENEKIVIFDGNIKGVFWDKEEYLNGVNEEEEEEELQDD